MDILIRSLISFLAIGVVFSIILIGYLHISWIFVLPLVFFVSVIIAPFLSKIKLADKVMDYYEGLLKKTFNLK
jgi:membrane protein implicated in regulation of membrane protease activity